MAMFSFICFVWLCVTLEFLFFLLSFQMFSFLKTGNASADRHLISTIYFRRTCSLLFSRCWVSKIFFSYWVRRAHTLVADKKETKEKKLLAMHDSFRRANWKNKQKPQNKLSLSSMHTLCSLVWLWVTLEFFFSFFFPLNFLLGFQWLGNKSRCIRNSLWMFSELTHIYTLFFIFFFFYMFM